jgi:hypothetical protein
MACKGVFPVITITAEEILLFSTDFYVVCLKSSVNGTRKKNKTEDTNKLTLLAFKIIALLHNTLLATFIQLPESVNKGIFRKR